MTVRILAARRCLTATLLLAAAATYLLGAGLARAAAIPDGAGGPGDAQLLQLADEYFDAYYFPNNPTAATAAGIHRYDDRLEDFSRAVIRQKIQALHSFERRLRTVDPAELSERVRGDRELLLSSIASALLDLETIRPWRKNPDIYSSGLTTAAFVIMERNFAPANARLRSLIARERAMPAVLAAARENLRDPPAIYTQIAIEQLPGSISFFEHDLPAAFQPADDLALQASFAKANAAVIAALKGYQDWLQQDLLPRSHGDFRLGAQTFSAKLEDDEMVDTPLPQLLQIGMQDLRRNQTEFARVAHELEPDRSAQQVLEELKADHPDGAHLLQDFRDTFDGLVSFIDSHQIITIPSTVRPIVRETPPFMRATTFASMDTPGPFETQAQEAYFSVTLPDPSWNAELTDGFLSAFNYPAISAIAAHEAYPGHYIQFLWMHQLSDRVRKLIGANSNAEGWAHYCEQMMLDEGYGQPGTGARDVRESKLLRLGQLQWALTRDARFIAGIELHTGQMSIEQAIDFFVNEGYQSRQTGEVETKRGTSDPTYLYYTLGKLQILKLRLDLQRRDGDRFSLRVFHDAFMQQGFPPIRLVRRALMHDDSPTL
jgi:uncharacterized protein (DUF885 family)